MAVQKSRKSRSRRGMRRAHDGLSTDTPFAVDPTTGTKHRRHHIAQDGYYRGKKILEKGFEDEE